MSQFDNIFLSVLNVFIIIIMEGWTEIMYFIRDATGSYIYDVYFHFCVIFGAFFVLKLLIAV